MNIFWILALAQTVFVSTVLFTGRIRMQGWAVIDRDIEPRRFRFFVIGFAVSIPMLIAAATFPWFSH